MTEEHKQKLRDYHAKPENKLKHSIATKKGLTKEEIAKAVGCGIATVYRVLKTEEKPQRAII